MNLHQYRCQKRYLPRIVLLILLVSRGAVWDVPFAETADKPSVADHLERVVRSSQAIIAVKVGECLNEKDAPPVETDRIVWNEEYTRNPDLRVGEHFAFINMKEKPEWVDDEFGGQFVREVLSPSVEVGLELFPQTYRVNGKNVTGRLWASYRALEIKNDAGLPHHTFLGVFGASYAASPYRGDHNIPGFQVTQSPCQVLVRFPVNEKNPPKSFFSLPLDLTNDGDFEDFCNRDYQQVKRVWSSYQGPKGERWVLWCRADPADKKMVIIRQCIVEEVRQENEAEGRSYWTWQRKTPLETASRKIGDQHTVSNLTFTISGFFIPDANPRRGWIHIADPKLDMSDMPK